MNYFPESVYDDAGAYAKAYFEHLSAAASTLDLKAMAAAGAILSACAQRRGTIFSCGNGGSASVANHLACDCLKGVRNGSTLKPKVHSLAANIELLTAIANDFGVDDLFEYQLSSMAEEGDVLIAISSSGASPNIIKTLKTAKEMGLATIAMTGFAGGAASKIADVSLYISAHNYGVVEDCHQSLMHILAQYMRHTHLQDPSQLGSVKF
jgi:D-sedoheptulose 7-phosphate isomerase